MKQKCVSNLRRLNGVRNGISLSPIFHSEKCFFLHTYIYIYIPLIVCLEFLGRGACFFIMLSLDGGVTLWFRKKFLKFFGLTRICFCECSKKASTTIWYGTYGGEKGSRTQIFNWLRVPKSIVGRALKHIWNFPFFFYLFLVKILYLFRKCFGIKKIALK